MVIAAVWGASFVVVKNALALVGPLTLIATRFWLAALVLWLVARLQNPPRGDRLWREGGFTGMFLTAGYVTQFIGMQTTTVGKSGFITGLYMALVPIFAALLLRQRPTRMAWLGVLLATVGLGLLTLERDLRLATGDVWILAGAFAYAAHILALGHYAPRHAVLPFTLVQVITVAAVASFAALGFERTALIPPTTAWLAVLYMAVIPTALTFGVQTWAQRSTPPTHAALIFALEPVFAALAGMLFLQERLPLKGWFGGILILTAMVVAELEGRMK